MHHSIAAQHNTCCTVPGRRSLLVHYPTSSQDSFCLVSAAPTAAGRSAAPETCSAAQLNATLPGAVRCSSTQTSQPAATEASFQVGQSGCMLTIRVSLLTASKHQTSLCIFIIAVSICNAPFIGHPLCPPPPHLSSGHTQVYAASVVKHTVCLHDMQQAAGIPLSAAMGHLLSYLYLHCRTAVFCYKLPFHLRSMTASA